MKTEAYNSRPVDMTPNSRFPLLVHRNAVPGGGADAIRGVFRENGWLNNWEFPGIYTYGHFHSTTHECLGCASGWMELRLSVESGMNIRVESGDVIVMPAGVSHAMTDHSADILMIGGYPDGRDWDNMQEAHIGHAEYYAAAKRIMMLPIPARDPVSGEPIRQWLDAPSSVDAGWNEYRDGLDPARDRSPAGAGRE